MKKYDEANRTASMKYNQAIRTGNHEEALNQLLKLIEIADKEGRPNDKEELESIISYIASSFNLRREMDKISSTEIKKSQEC